MKDNVFQDPEWWKQNVKKGDWIKYAFYMYNLILKKDDLTVQINEFESLFSSVISDDPGENYIYFTDNSIRVMDVVEVLEIRRKGE